MNSRRVGLLIIVTAAAAALTACSSGSSPFSSSHAAGSGHSTLASSTAAGSSAATSAANTPAGSSATSLATSLKNGLASVHSLHLTLNITAAGARITGAGDEKIANGTLQAMQITEALPGGQSIRIVVVDGKVYAKLPHGTNPAGKPYVLVSPTSSNPTIRGIAQSLDSALQSASAQSATVFAQAASSVTNRGRTTVAGQPVTHYSVVVDPQKLPANLPGRAELTKVGVTAIPVEMYVDGQNRLVQLTEHLTVAGQSTASAVTISRYNQPVTITAPPANQVSTS